MSRFFGKSSESANRRTQSASGLIGSVNELYMSLTEKVFSVPGSLTKPFGIKRLLRPSLVQRKRRMNGLPMLRMYWNSKCREIIPIWRVVFTGILFLQVTARDPEIDLFIQYYIRSEGDWSYDASKNLLGVKSQPTIKFCAWMKSTRRGNAKFRGFAVTIRQA